MCAQDSNGENIPFRTDTYYEERARQEEIYLEETEEELRMILESDHSPQSRSESFNGQKEHAAEELITGDSDDPSCRLFDSNSTHDVGAISAEGQPLFNDLPVCRRSHMQH